MKLKTLGISNYRSFDEEGVLLEDIQKINVLIGKNNCGKSNFLRFIKSIGENRLDLMKFPNDIYNQHRRNGKPAFIKIDYSGAELIVKDKDFRGYDRGNLRDFVVKKHTFIYNLTGETIINIREVFKGLSSTELLPFQNAYSRADSDTLLGQIESIIKSKISSLIREEFKNIIYIPHLRVIKEGHKFGDSNSSIDGSNIISQMFKMQNPDVGEESNREKFDKIQDFVRSLLNNEGLVIEVPHNKENILINLDGNRLPLEYFGTGIHQLVLLCSTLVIHDNSIVCMEEPEIHLHPELQRKFLNFLLETSNAYFLTTHSNVFLEYNKDISIYHVSYDGIKSSVHHCKTTAHTYELLANLGYRASDLLHSNGIIWVEGPSDRTLINKWISISDSRLLEGIHYSIMYYGGRLLSTLSFNSEHNAEQVTYELIPLLRINKNAFVVIDRDGFSSKKAINRTKERVCNEIGEGKFWVTKGREIENYLHNATVNTWLEDSVFENDEDNHLGDLIRKFKPKLQYDKNKNGYIKELAEYINEDSLDVLDLKKQLKNLISAIYRWNI